MFSGHLLLFHAKKYRHDKNARLLGKGFVRVRLRKKWKWKRGIFQILTKKVMCFVNTFSVYILKAKQLSLFLDKNLL